MRSISVLLLVSKIDNRLYIQYVHASYKKFATPIGTCRIRSEVHRAGNHSKLLEMLSGVGM